ncbi:hypothetical protein J3459_008293 [Metarhizium acridum]|nr:hypothetical protein J3459_008293 [Metarhizium acridum]
MSTSASASASIPPSSSPRQTAQRAFIFISSPTTLETPELSGTPDPRYRPTISRHFARPAYSPTRLAYEACLRGLPTRLTRHTSHTYPFSVTRSLPVCTRTGHAGTHHIAITDKVAFASVSSLVTSSSPPTVSIIVIALFIVFFFFVLLSD